MWVTPLVLFSAIVGLSSLDPLYPSESDPNFMKLFERKYSNLLSIDQNRCLQKLTCILAKNQTSFEDPVIANIVRDFETLKNIHTNSPAYPFLAAYQTGLSKQRCDKRPCRDLLGKMMLPTETAEEIRAKYTEMQIELENLEIERGAADEVPADSVTSELYLQLMAIYLIQNDLPNAKFVWKRAPDNIRKSASLSGMHRVFLALWSRDFPATYTALNGTNWTPSVQPLIADLRSLTVLRARSLLSNSYADVSQEDFCLLMGVPMSTEGVAEACAELGWTLNGGRVIPAKPAPPTEQPLMSEAHLAKLAEFISFLEC